MTECKTCLVCNKLFEKSCRESRKVWLTRKYCSKLCVNNSPRSPETREKMRQRKLGKPSWNKGKRLTDEHKKALRKKHKPLSDITKQRMSMARKGKKLPWEWRYHMSLGQRGAKGSNWQGGKTKIHDTLRRSSRYREWRIKVYERDNYTCQVCRQRGGKLNADHIKPFALFPDLRFEVDNGRTLCVPCHRKTETYGKNKRWVIEQQESGSKNTNAS